MPLFIDKRLHRATNIQLHITGDNSQSARQATSITTSQPSQTPHARKRHSLHTQSRARPHGATEATKQMCQQKTRATISHQQSLQEIQPSSHTKETMEHANSSGEFPQLQLTSDLNGQSNEQSEIATAAQGI